MSVLDYLSDFICVLYGVPGAYGVVTMPFSVREGRLTRHILEIQGLSPSLAELLAYFSASLYLCHLVPLSLSFPTHLVTCHNVR